MSELLPDPGIAARVAAIRHFNRFYTRQIGVLREHLLESPFSLAESRVLYELAHHSGATPTDLAEELDLDLGYLSRSCSASSARGSSGERSRRWTAAG